MRSDEIVADFDRGKLTVQGDGRPFSSGRVTPIANLKRADVAVLTHGLALPRDKRDTLTTAVWRIMASYLGPLVLSEQLANRAKSLALLNSISRLSSKLAKQIGSLDHEFLHAIEEHRADPDKLDDVPMFDTFQLTHKLERFAQASQNARRSLRPNSTGAPPKAHLDKTMGYLLDAIEAAGLPLTFSNSSFDEPRRQIHGAGGELLLAIFARLDSHTDMPRIWGAADRLNRTGARPARAAKA